MWRREKLGFSWTAEGYVASGQDYQMVVDTEASFTIGYRGVLAPALGLSIPSRNQAGAKLWESLEKREPVWEWLI